MKNTMQAYHNDPALKESVLAEMAAHRQAERLVQSYGYWRDGKGCAVGCLIKSGQHSQYETRFGIPQALARLEDGIFEGLPLAQVQAWPERFLSAINPGADLSMVSYRFMHWLLVDETDGVIKYAKTPKKKTAVNNIGLLFKCYIAGEPPAKEAWLIARAAAYAAYAYADVDAADADAADADAADADAADAAAYAAYAAADAAYAAYAAADAADAADAYAYAYAAADSYAYAAADAAAAYAYAAYAAVTRQRARVKQADKLIELLKAAL